MTHVKPDRDFTPISPNPFIVGNPVRDRSMFFGREAEFAIVRRHVQDSETGVLLVFCGERRSGKTSILFQILDQRLGPDCIPVLIDMQLEVGGEDELFTRISDKILETLGLEHRDVGPLRIDDQSNREVAFREFVREVLKRHPGKKLILMFDEYEILEDRIDKGMLSVSVLRVLAGLMEHLPVFIVFTGSQHLEQRHQEYWKPILGRSFFKRISFLERADALNLIQRPLEGRIQFGPGVVEAIYRLSAGQPFYTQAICQNLVEQLNERRTREATVDMLTDVVDAIIKSPLPQMIFRWNDLGKDDKLVLSLLAESLPEEDSGATVKAMLRQLHGYPLTLDTADVATKLEYFVDMELLQRTDRGGEAAYSFRMDLWRQWIKRRHTVWQVMSEVGFDIRPRPWWRGKGARWAGSTAAVIGVATIALVPVFRRPKPTPPAPLAMLAIDVQPAQALIHHEGLRVGIGSFVDSIVAATPQRFRFTAAGFADTEIVVALDAGATERRTVAMRELLGRLRIETAPAGASIQIDGKPVGKSPLHGIELSAARPHVITAVFAGYKESRQEVTIQAGHEAVARFALEPGAYDILATTQPAGARIQVDGVSRGESPIRLHGLGAGPHVISASREGYDPAETTVVVSERTAELRLTLVQKPPGTLVVQGDQLAAIYIDGVFVVQGVQHTRKEVIEGSHHVKVVLSNGSVIDTLVQSRSRAKVTYDYSSGVVTHGPQESSPE